jgi:DNA-binding HxlR family transcriptional regulator
MSDEERGANLDFDKVIHERARLKILVYLASSQEKEVGFTDMKKALSMTAGNLSVQLGTLEEAGYIFIKKIFVGKKPYTGLSLAPAGSLALERYLDEVQSMLSLLRNSRE